MKIFLFHLQHYVFEILPSLVLGFLISGIVHELIPQKIIEDKLAKKGILPLLYVVITGIILPVCCFGSLPIAVTLRKKGVPLGPVLSFLVATPATSISAILVTLKLMGLGFTLYLCFGVIFMGILIGLIGNFFDVPLKESVGETCPMCEECEGQNHQHHKKGFLNRIKSVFYYAFFDLPKEIGLEILIGILLAAIVSSFTPVGYFIKNFLKGFAGYVFALIFGLLMYICATASVPLAHAFIQQGLAPGAGLVLLLVGPITSYGTILVVKKEFGIKILFLYLAVISLVSILLGVVYP